MNNPRSVKVYLDQNILSEISGIFPNPVISGFKLVPVYSHAHLEELANWKNEPSRNRCCAWLANNGAELIQLVKTGDDPNSTFNKFFDFMKPHLISGQIETKGSDVASFVKIDPIQSVQNIIVQREKKGPMNMLQVLGLKLAGGLQDKTIEELISPFIEEIKKTNKHGKSQLGVLSGVDPQESERFQTFLRDVAVSDAEADRVKENLVKSFENAIEKSKTPLGIREYRQALCLDPKLLNNLELPNIFQKIYDLACLSLSMPLNTSYQNFWNLQKNLNSLYARVTMLHTHLNYLGYWADEKLQQGGPFMGASRDGWHLANSVFCDFFITKDKRLFKKAEAIFEFLKIKTKLALSDDISIHLSKIP